MATIGELNIKLSLDNGTYQADLLKSTQATQKATESMAKSFNKLARSTQGTSKSFRRTGTAAQQMGEANKFAQLSLLNTGRALEDGAFFAQDFRFGLISISNNLTPMIEGLAATRKAAAAAGTTMRSAILGSLGGAGGVIFLVQALSAALTAGTILWSKYGKSVEAAESSLSDAVQGIVKIRSEQALTFGRAATDALISSFQLQADAAQEAAKTIEASSGIARTAVLLSFGAIGLRIDNATESSQNLNKEASELLETYEEYRDALKDLVEEQDKVIKREKLLNEIYSDPANINVLKNLLEQIELQTKLGIVADEQRKRAEERRKRWKEEERAAEALRKAWESYLETFERIQMDATPLGVMGASSLEEQQAFMTQRGLDFADLEGLENGLRRVRGATSDLLGEFNNFNALMADQVLMNVEEFAFRMGDIVFSFESLPQLLKDFGSVFLDTFKSILAQVTATITKMLVLKGIFAAFNLFGLPTQTGSFLGNIFQGLFGGPGPDFGVFGAGRLDRVATPKISVTAPREIAITATKGVGDLSRYGLD